ncbi:MAG TPA: hypothetical protein DCQ32_02100 [Cyanobacteria bacterium UBA8156]|nr:hypothetical protein [Cyanobacteria bacterium UBA8156]
MKTCPWCGNPLLPHLRSHTRQMYWYCSGCRQEMPDVEGLYADLHRQVTALVHIRFPACEIACVLPEDRKSYQSASAEAISERVAVGPISGQG